MAVSVHFVPLEFSFCKVWLCTGCTVQLKMFNVSLDEIKNRRKIQHKPKIRDRIAQVCAFVYIYIHICIYVYVWGRVCETP